jgi:hypothetical protein
MCPRPGLGRPLNFFGYLSKVKKNQEIFKIKFSLKFFRKKNKL